MMPEDAANCQFMAAIDIMVPFSLIETWVEVTPFDDLWRSYGT